MRVVLIQSDRIATVMQEDVVSRATLQELEAEMKESYTVDGLPIHVEASIAAHRTTLSKSAFSIYDRANDRTSRDNPVQISAGPDTLRYGPCQRQCGGSLSERSQPVHSIWKHDMGYLLPVCIIGAPFLLAVIERIRTPRVRGVFGGSTQSTGSARMN